MITAYFNHGTVVNDQNIFCSKVYFLGRKKIFLCKLICISLAAGAIVGRGGGLVSNQPTIESFDRLPRNFKSSRGSMVVMAMMAINTEYTA